MIENEKKRELILTTAREILIKNGYAKTTLDDIAEAIGMKKSSLYYYYTNKEALIEDVMKREQQKFCSMIQTILDKKESALDKIIEYEVAKFKYIEQSVKLHQFSSNILFEFKHKIYEHIKAMQAKEVVYLKDILDESIKKKEIKNCDTKRVAELILTISEALRHREFYFSSFIVNKEVEFSKAIEEMIFAIKLIFDGLTVKNNKVKTRTNLKGK